jgi:hypothetical protein
MIDFSIFISIPFPLVNFSFTILPLILENKKTLEKKGFRSESINCPIQNKMDQSVVLTQTNHTFEITLQKYDMRKGENNDFMF